LSVQCNRLELALHSPVVFHGAVLTRLSH
jgi:hypothetical protein